MLRKSEVLHSTRGKRYTDRFRCFPHRSWKSRWAPPNSAHRPSPLAHKRPEEWPNTWDQRVGVEWHHKLRRRGLYRTWPWITWRDDPLRQHKDPSALSRIFSVKALNGCTGEPLWNYYEETAQDYRIPDDGELFHLVPIITTYAGKVWTKEQTSAYLSEISARWPTVVDVANSQQAIAEWNEPKYTIPLGFLQHVHLLTNDVVRQNAMKHLRRERHKKGMLRTVDMETYYALPYITGPAMPTTLEQAPGKMPEGAYRNMMKSPFHPLHVPDAYRSKNMMPN